MSGKFCCNLRFENRIEEQSRKEKLIDAVNGLLARLDDSIGSLEAELPKLEIRDCLVGSGPAFPIHRERNFGAALSN